MTLSKHDRVQAALQGRSVDRPPVAAWRHFLPEERSEKDFVEASVAFARINDWDWLKINPRATYYAEVFGNIYDYGKYAGVLPRLSSSAIQTPADLSRLKAVRTSDPVLAEQLRVVSSIRKSLRDVPIIQTVFSPLSVLQFLTIGLAGQNGQPDPGTDYTVLHSLLVDHPRQVRDALAAITETLQTYARKAIDAGADGIFFAIVRLAREAALTHEQYLDFEKPYDLEVLQGARRGTFNVLHTCGPKVYFDAAEDYPVHAVNWATLGEGNPTLAEGQRRLNKAVMGGVEEGAGFSSADPAKIQDQAATAIRTAGKGRFLLSPGCAVDPDVPVSHLSALRKAVETAPTS
ncbi:MAG: uroporphyrinogen decarboxylase family protein [Spirochaetia bacterium]|jgi:uroporphyrinogen decarboxylase